MTMGLPNVKEGCCKIAMDCPNVKVSHCGIGKNTVQSVL